MALSRPQMFDALSIATIVAAVAVGAWRGSPVPPAVFEPDATQAAPGVARADSVLGSRAFGDSTAIVNANIFSASRRAPRVRFVSPDAAVPEAPPSLPSLADAMADSAGRDSASASNSDAVPHLYAIVSQDGVRRALLRLSRQD